MPRSVRSIELLAPARDAEIAIAAIDHGADAVYLGGPDFSARHQAGNPVEQLARVADYAHRYRARVYVTLNTLLQDEELPRAEAMIQEVCSAGIDALIVQDMAVLEMDLPPVELHASTQAHIDTVEKALFLHRAGFSRLVLARELSLPQIEAIARESGAKIEAFVHGALCVSYSGQCYLSQALCGRSANRGRCAQVCRLPFDVLDPEGHLLRTGTHALSLKDMNRSAHLEALIDAGVCSLKIEGTLCAAHTPADTPQKARLEQALSKLGGTEFEARHIAIAFPSEYFLPLSAVSALRRQTLEALREVRLRSVTGQRQTLPHAHPPLPPGLDTDYRLNVSNRLARQFYRQCGAARLAPAYEQQKVPGAQLAVCLHCLQYSLGLCPRQHPGKGFPYLVLRHGRFALRAEFDCAHCRMKLFALP